MTAKQKKMLFRILIASVLLIAVAFSPVTGPLRLVLFLIPYFIVGYDILLKAAKGISNGRIFDENLLMTVATIGAIAIALYDNTGDYTEAVAVMLFYQIGEWFQAYAVGRSRKNISQLMDIRPDYANIEKDGKLEQVDPDEIEIGSVIVVQPGEKVPIDGVVVEGESTLNTSALTGESLPRNVSVNNEIISGCINLSGLLKIRTTKLFGESTVSQILELVENASSRKSRSEAFISRFARVYTPIVFVGALALATIPPLVQLFLLNTDAQWNDWIYRALVFLVISCPCALVISIPLSFFAGIGGVFWSKAQTTWKRYPRPKYWFLIKPAHSPKVSLKSSVYTTINLKKRSFWNWLPWPRVPPLTPSVSVCRKPTVYRSTAAEFETFMKSAVKVSLLKLMTWKSRSEMTS